MMEEDANTAELKGDVCRFISSWWAAHTRKTDGYTLLTDDDRLCWFSFAGR